MGLQLGSILPHASQVSDLSSLTGSSYHQWRVDITTGHLLKPPLNVSLRAETSPFGAPSLSIHHRGSQDVSFHLLKSSV